MESSADSSARPPAPADDGRTRDRVSSLLLEHGAQTATELAARLGVSPAAVRRHLDALVAEGRIAERAVPGAGRDQHRGQHRGPGRPARHFVLTDAGRSTFPHAYDDLALTALRFVAAHGGPDAVRDVAELQLAGLEQRCSQAVELAAATTGPEPVDRAQVLAEALTAEGYAASASAISSGGQLCQHHCPVAHVAAEFPQLCEAETAVIGRLVGTHVQRLATIAHGDGICTTHIPSSHIPSSQHPSRPTHPAGNTTRPDRPVPTERAALRTPADRRPAPSHTRQTDRERTPA